MKLGHSKESPTTNEKLTNQERDTEQKKKSWKDYKQVNL